MKKLITAALLAAVALPVAMPAAQAQSQREVRRDRQDVRQERRDVQRAERRGNPQQIRQERRPNSRYASIENCRHEISEAEAMMRRAGIRWLSTTSKSIEEIATTILQELRPERLNY